MLHHAARLMRSRQATGLFAATVLVMLCAGLGSGAASASSSNPATSTTVTANPTVANLDEPIVLTATVTGVGGNPTGTVSFYANGGSACGTATLTSVPGSTTQSQASCTVSGWAAGVYAITATFKSNDILDYFNSTSASTNVSVSATQVFDTALVLTSTPADSISFGQNVTFVASVSETGGGTTIPTGTVTFSDITGGANSPVLLGSAPIDSSGNATLVVGGFLTGSHTISASYAGDSIDRPASGSLTLQVNPDTSQPVATTATLSASSTSLTAGDSATLTAHVVQTGSSTTPAAGELVTFTANGVLLGQAPLDGNGNAVLTISGWTAGSYDIQAFYNGDAGFLASSADDITLIVAPAASQAVQTTTVVTVTPTPITAAQVVTIVATVSQVGTQTAPPQGEFVTFTANGTYLGVAPLDANGTATLVIGGWIAGTYDIQASYFGDIAYRGSAGDVTLPVAPGRPGPPAPLTVTAPSAAFTYGGTLPTLAAPTYSGFVSGDTVASLSTPATCTTTATSNSPAGTYPVTCSGATDVNYAIAYVSGSVTVNPAALKVTAPASTSITYGSALPALTPTYSGFVKGETTASLSSLATCTTTATSSSPAGTYPVTCSGAVDPNYTITYVTGTLTIKPAALTVTAPSATITTGSPVPTLTPTYSGFVNGDTAASLSAPATCTTTATSSSPAGSYPVTCAGAVDPNYTITYVAGTLTVGSVQPAKPTTLKYTGDTSGSYGDPTTLSATLTTSAGSPVAGAMVTISLGSQSCAAVTSSSGRATCSITLAQPVGTYPVSASFAGTSLYKASTASATFKIVPETTQISLLYSAPALLGSKVTLSALLTQDVSTPVPNETVTLSLGSQHCTALTDSSGLAKCSVTVSGPLGPTTASAVFAGDKSYAASSDTDTVIVYANAPSGCTYVIGDRSSSGWVNFWGPQWSKQNSLSGGSAPSSFKGYASQSNGGSWNSGPGDSNGPSGSLPAYMAVYVASSIGKSGSSISGNIVHLVIVKTDPGSSGTRHRRRKRLLARPGLGLPRAARQPERLLTGAVRGTGEDEEQV